MKKNVGIFIVFLLLGGFFVLMRGHSTEALIKAPYVYIVPLIAFIASFFLPKFIRKLRN